MEPRALGERFEVGQRLGAGSFGVVWEAFDVSFHSLNQRPRFNMVDLGEVRTEYHFFATDPIDAASDQLD